MELRAASKDGQSSCRPEKLILLIVTDGKIEMLPVCMLCFIAGLSVYVTYSFLKRKRVKQHDPSNIRIDELNQSASQK